MLLQNNNCSHVPCFVFFLADNIFWCQFELKFISTEHAIRFLLLKNWNLKQNRSNIPYKSEISEVKKNVFLHEFNKEARSSVLQLFGEQRPYLKFIELLFRSKFHEPGVFVTVQYFEVQFMAGLVVLTHST